MNQTDARHRAHFIRMSMSRRTFLSDTIGPVAGLALFATVLGRPTITNASAPAPCFGSLGTPDPSGLRLPPGFTSRVVARSGDVVDGTDHTWHAAPDGGGCFARPDGGWIYASNSEVWGARGGVSCLSFDPAGNIDNAYPILSGTSINCAGGVTPWETWLSCEEFDAGKVWECDPLRSGEGVVRPALGTFAHEAAAVDPATGAIYLTEDRHDGRLYRFVPDRLTDLTSGSLFAAIVSKDPAAMRTGDTAKVTWQATSPDEPDRSPATAAFDGGEGIWIDQGRMLFTTKHDRRVWAIDLATSTLSVLHDCVQNPETALDAVDNIVVHQTSGDVFVAEDGGNMQLGVLCEIGDAVQIDAFLEFAGHDASEVTGPAFSPDGTKLYLSSQRGTDGRGITYEVTGPFAHTSGSDNRLRPARRMADPDQPAPQDGGPRPRSRPITTINGPAVNGR